MDTNEKKKRTRAPNFLYHEEQVLLKLGSQHSVLENRVTDANTNKQKDAAWEEIAKKFNSNTTKGINKQ